MDLVLVAWNGLGGKVNEGETIEGAVRREAKEEAEVSLGELNKVADIEFYYDERGVRGGVLTHTAPERSRNKEALYFPPRPDFTQRVHVYFVEKWQGEPTETEEMCPKWFALEEIPFEKMWADDIYWLPEVLKGKKLKCSFTFGEGDVVLEKSVREVDGLYL